MKVVMKRSARVMFQDHLVKDFSLCTVCYLTGKRTHFLTSIILHFFLVIKDRLIAERGLLLLIILLFYLGWKFIFSPFVSYCLLNAF